MRRVVAAVAPALPATAGAAAPVVLSAPGGATLSVRDVKGAARVAQHAPATVELVPHGGAPVQPAAPQCGYRGTAVG